MPIPITPILPPYGKIDAEVSQCIARAAETYQVPELLLHSIILTENGTKGQCVVNRDKATKKVLSMDCGLSQINTVHLKDLSKYGITLSHLAHDSCLNVSTSAYILRQYFDVKKDWTNTIVAYNIGPNNWTPARLQVGKKYAIKVIGYWNQLYAYVSKYKNS